MSSIFLVEHQSPGDICMLTAAVRDLKAACPDLRINVETSASYLWENNPNIDPGVTRQNADKVIRSENMLVMDSNNRPHHFVESFRAHLELVLGKTIPQGEHRLDVYLNDKEKGHGGIIETLPERYWVINAGTKSDFTAKGWSFGRYCEVVERLRGKVNFVQVGKSMHRHEVIPGAINLIDKTPDREILRVIYHSAGVLTGVSFPMHLSMMDTSPAVTGRRYRPCVCIAGGREPITWIQQANMQCFHTCGILDCNRKGGCWRSRVLPLNDNKESDKRLCLHPVVDEYGRTVPMCMDMITADQVADKILLCERTDYR